MRRIVALFICVVFLTESFFPLAYAEVVMPLPGRLVGLSNACHPAVLNGVKLYVKEPFRFDFILDPGEAAGAVPEASERATASRLIRYFLAALTIPEDDLWVNLSPYEKDRIVPEAFGQTEMGRDLLAQDYFLKQITSSLIYPEGDTGKLFWQKIYALAAQKFGSANIPVDTFNKVWIVPAEVVVYENAPTHTAYVVKSRLKVMLDSDYLAARQQAGYVAPTASASDDVKEILRQVIIPVLEKEVNEGRNFTQLRQVYHSLILATWYKKKVKDSLLSRVYVDRRKVAGVNINDPQEAVKIWGRYVEAFKKGVYNYIREEYDPLTRETIPRKYFAGGVLAKITAMTMVSTVDPAELPVQSRQVNVQISAEQAAIFTARGGEVLTKPVVAKVEGVYQFVKVVRIRNVATPAGEKLIESLKKQWLHKQSIATSFITLAHLLDALTREKYAIAQEIDLYAAVMPDGRILAVQPVRRPRKMTWKNTNKLPISIMPWVAEEGQMAVAQRLLFLVINELNAAGVSLDMMDAGGAFGFSNVPPGASSREVKRASMRSNLPGMLKYVQDNIIVELNADALAGNVSANKMLEQLRDNENLLIPGQNAPDLNNRINKNLGHSLSEQQGSDGQASLKENSTEDVRLFNGALEKKVIMQSPGGEYRAVDVVKVSATKSEEAKLLRQAFVKALVRQSRSMGAINAGDVFSTLSLAKTIAKGLLGQREVYAAVERNKKGQLEIMAVQVVEKKTGHLVMGSRINFYRQGSFSAVDQVTAFAWHDQEQIEKEGFVFLWHNAHRVIHGLLQSLSFFLKPEFQRRGDKFSNARVVEVIAAIERAGFNVPSADTDIDRVNALLGSESFLQELNAALVKGETKTGQRVSWLMDIQNKKPRKINEPLNRSQVRALIRHNFMKNSFVVTPGDLDVELLREAIGDDKHQKTNQLMLQELAKLTNASLKDVLKSDFMQVINGFLDLKVAEFEDFDQLQALTRLIESDTKMSISSGTSMEELIDALNKSEASFIAFVKLKQAHALSDDHLHAINTIIKTLSVQSRDLIDAQEWIKLNNTSDGKRFKRFLLKTLYPRSTPKNLINAIVQRRDFYRYVEDADKRWLDEDAKVLLQKAVKDENSLNDQEVARLNSVLLRTIYSKAILGWRMAETKEVSQKEQASATAMLGLIQQQNPYITVASGDDLMARHTRETAYLREIATTTQGQNDVVKRNTVADFASNNELKDEGAFNLFTGELVNKVVFERDGQYLLADVVRFSDLKGNKRTLFLEKLKKVITINPQFAMTGKILGLLVLVDELSNTKTGTDIYVAVSMKSSDILAIQVVENYKDKQPSLFLWISLDPNSRFLAHQIFAFAIHDLLLQGKNKVNSSGVRYSARIRKILPSGINNVEEMNKFLVENSLGIIRALEKASQEGNLTADSILKRIVNQSELLKSPVIDRANGTGGIDLTADRMRISTAGAMGDVFDVDPAEVARLAAAPGFVPVIIGVEDAVDLPAFLGMPSSQH